VEFGILVKRRRHCGRPGSRVVLRRNASLDK